MNSSISKIPTNPMKTQAEDLSRYFSKQDILMATRHRKRCSASVIIREMEIKTSVRDHLMLVRMAIILKKKSTSNTFWRGSTEEATLLHCWWEGNWYNHCGEQYGGSLKTKMRITVWFSHPTAGHILGEYNNSKSFIHPNVHCSTIWNSQILEAT